MDRDLENSLGGERVGRVSKKGNCGRFDEWIVVVVFVVVWVLWHINLCWLFNV